MKKLLIVTVVLMLLLTAGCQSDHALSQPETNLEFWIAENVDDVDFSEYQEKYGMFGGTQYYGTGYVPTVNEDGQQVDPEYCVLYTVTSYPDYSSKTRHITHISITDPSVEVYGLTLQSSREDIQIVMENEGFNMEEVGTNTLVARKGDYTFAFSPDVINITVNVTNKLGIVF